MRKFNTIQDVLDLDLNIVSRLGKVKRNVEDMRARVLRGQEFAERRYNRLKEAYSKIKEKVPNYPIPFALSEKGVYNRILSAKDIKNLDYTQLVDQYTHISNFLNERSSTLTGWQDYLSQWINKVHDTLKDKYGIDIIIRKKDFALFWEIYNRVDENAMVSNANVNYEIYRDVAEAITINKKDLEELGIKTPEEIATFLKNKLKDRTVEEEINKVKDEETPNEIDYENVFGRRH